MWEYISFKISTPREKVNRSFYIKVLGALTFTLSNWTTEEISAKNATCLTVNMLLEEEKSVYNFSCSVVIVIPKQSNWRACGTIWLWAVSLGGTSELERLCWGLSEPATLAVRTGGEHLLCAPAGLSALSFPPTPKPSNALLSGCKPAPSPAQR